MKHLTRRLPSPGVVVGLVALVAALGGTAAALPGNNGVNSGDIKNNSIRGKDVRNNNLTGKDIKNLGGADINEGSLSKVPSATQADNATNATNAATATNAGSVNTLKPFGPVALTEGQDATLHSQGSLSIVGQCLEDGTGTDTEVHATTTEENSFFSGDDGTDVFGPTTPEADRTFEEQGASDAPGGEPELSDGYDDQFWVNAPSGTTFQGTVGSTANADTNGCTFFGSIIVVK